MSASALSCPSSYQRGCEGGLLLEMLGPKVFKKVQKAFGGKRVWIPKPGARMPCGVCALRDACIRAWRGQGQTVASISRHLGISAKSVYRVLSS